MGKRKKNPPSIEEIIKNKWIVRFNRKPFEESTLACFILDANDDFTLTNEVDDDAGSIGFQVFRNKTIKKFRVYDDSDWHESLVVKLKSIEPKERPNISIKSFEDLLKTVNENFPLIMIHYEKIATDECKVGRILEIKNKSFLMQEISPNAEWDEKPTKLKFKDITRISFGNGYENNLALVAEYRDKQKIGGN